MKLTDPVIKAAKPKDKSYKLSDGDGLVLLIQPNDSKWWRFRYQYNGKEKMLSIGTYPEVTLKDARKKRDEANELLKRNIDPSLHRQEQKQQAAIAQINNFESVARLWWIKWGTARNKRYAN